MTNSVEYEKPTIHANMSLIVLTFLIMPLGSTSLRAAEFWEGSWQGTWFTNDGKDSGSFVTFATRTEPSEYGGMVQLGIGSGRAVVPGGFIRLYGPVFTDSSGGILVGAVNSLGATSGQLFDTQPTPLGYGLWTIFKPMTFEPKSIGFWSAYRAFGLASLAYVTLHSDQLTLYSLLTIDDNDNVSGTAYSSSGDSYALSGTVTEDMLQIAGISEDTPLTLEITADASRIDEQQSVIGSWTLSDGSGGIVVAVPELNSVSILCAVIACAVFAKTSISVLVRWSGAAAS